MCVLLPVVCTANTSDEGWIHREKITLREISKSFFYTKPPADPFISFEAYLRRIAWEEQCFQLFSR
jgi:hypothetical protein